MKRELLTVVPLLLLAACVAGPEEGSEELSGPTIAEGAENTGEETEARPGASEPGASEVVSASECGDLGQACCWSGIPHAPSCYEDGVGCTSSSFLSPGICVPCGGLGQPCCEERYQCAPCEGGKRKHQSYCCDLVQPECSEGACMVVGTTHACL